MCLSKLILFEISSIKPVLNWLHYILFKTWIYRVIFGLTFGVAICTLLGFLSVVTNILFPFKVRGTLYISLHNINPQLHWFIFNFTPQYIYINPQQHYFKQHCISKIHFTVLLGVLLYLWRDNLPKKDKQQMHQIS